MNNWKDVRVLRCNVHMIRALIVPTATRQPLAAIRPITKSRDEGAVRCNGVTTIWTRDKFKYRRDDDDAD